MCGIVKDVCEAIWEALQPEFVKMPGGVARSEQAVRTDFGTFLGLLMESM